MNPPVALRGAGRAGRRLLLALSIRALPLLGTLWIVGCDRPAVAPPAAATWTPDSIEARFANVRTATDYVGDSSCVGCHAAEAASYAQHSMAKSFHRWTPDVRVEQAMATALRNAPTGYAYRVVDSAGALWQVETRPGDAAQPVHELRRRIDYVMGSGRLARTYFTEENGRLFQLPLTWYANHGWDFSPGYEINNARFSRMLPDRCVACHSSYPVAAPHLEGKYPVLRPGIGCERCHGPGALHVKSRGASSLPAPAAGAFDSTIVNPVRLPLDRRLDTCEQCHVHTSVAVLRDGRTAFDFSPARQLEAQYAYFKNGGDIDLVSHADRLRQSACFIASKNSDTPLECASCHNPHAPPPTKATRNQPCLSCHTSGALTAAFTGAKAAQRASHVPSSDCVSCHMPVVKERTVPHGTFSDHWIRVPSAGTAPSVPAQRPIDPYFARDRVAPDGPLYTAMGKVVFASLSGDGRVFDDASAELTPLLAGNRTNPQAHFLLGVAHQARGRQAEAVRALEDALALGDTRPDVLRALAQSKVRLGELRDARTLYEQALSMQPALAWMRAEYADLLQQQGELDRAVQEYRSALVEQPSLAAAAFNLGIAQLALDREGDAASAFLNAVRLDPAYATALDALFDVRASEKSVKQLARRTSPAPMIRSAPVPGAIAVRAAGTTRVAFEQVPPNGFVLVYAPDGTLLLAVPSNGGGTVEWDLRSGDGRVLPPGLYRVEAQAKGVPMASPSTWFAVVRR